MEDQDDDGLFEVMEENESFQHLFNAHCSVESFMHRENPVCVRSSTADDAEQDSFLKFLPDVDGCVLELSNWNAVDMPVRHLKVCNNFPRDIYSLLKKHIDLSKYSERQLSNFRKSLGFQLFYECGWEGWVGVIPRVVSSIRDLTKEAYREMSCEFFQRVRSKFQRNLFSVKDLIGRTLAKNDLNDVRKIFVLPDDSSVILNEFQKSIDEAEIDRNFEVINFCFRFGDKATGGVSLTNFKTELIEKMTIHCAVDISSDEMELMWSRAGVQDIVGERGVLHSCLSFRDCVCYQSNIDGKLMDISPNLRQIVQQPDRFRFVQLYVDSPHRRPHTRFNPVSGTIAGGMVYPKPTADAFERDAKKYISTLDSNFRLMTNASCRLEFVCEVKTKDTVLATDCLYMEKLRCLLRTHPMLVPFEKGTYKIIQSIGLWITKMLKTLLDQFQATGNIEAIWKAFQLELAAEKILWGYPLCFRSHPYSVGLGPGKLHPSFSLTDQLGFLAFSGWSSSMGSEDSIPPCEIWTRSPLICEKIKRSVGMHDVLSSGPCVLGRRLLHAQIKDLYEASKAGTCVRYEEYQQDLHSDITRKMRVNSCISVKQIVTLLCRKRRVNHHMIFAALCKILEGSRHELGSILEAGFQEIDLKHFPAIQNYDENGHAVLTWNWRAGLWKLVDSEQLANQSSAFLTSMVKAQLEVRGLVYASRLKSARDITFPWIEKSTRKLKSEKLDDNKLIDVLCFVSCVALMMNGWYVDYSHLEKLLIELPLNQNKLKGLEIQSKLLMVGFNKFKLFRLHHTIPHQILTVSKAADSQRKTVENESRICTDSERIESNPSLNAIDDEMEVNMARIEKRQPLCLPLETGGIKRKWGADELEILHDVNRKKKNKLEEKYETFKAECVSKNIPFRTKKAFKVKLSRL